MSKKLNWKAIRRAQIRPGEKLGVAIHATRNLNWSEPKSHWVLYILRRAGLPLTKEPELDLNRQTCNTHGITRELAENRHCHPDSKKGEKWKALAGKLTAQPTETLQAAAAILEIKRKRRKDGTAYLQRIGWAEENIESGRQLIANLLPDKLPKT